PGCRPFRAGRPSRRRARASGGWNRRNAAPPSKACGRKNPRSTSGFGYTTLGYGDVTRVERWRGIASPQKTGWTSAVLTATARLARSIGPGPTGPERRIGERIGPTPSANSPHRRLALLERRKGTVFVLRLGIGRAPVIVVAAHLGRRQRHRR